MNTAKRSSAKKAHDAGYNDTETSKLESIIVAKWNLNVVSDMLSQEWPGLGDEPEELLFNKSKDDQENVTFKDIAIHGKYQRWFLRVILIYWYKEFH